jgi:hypothetical protein
MASKLFVDEIETSLSSLQLSVVGEIKLSTGKAIKNAAGTDLLTEAGALGSGVTTPAAGITGTIGSGVTFPAGHVLKTYYNEFVTKTTAAPEAWRDVVSVTTDVPLSTSSDFLIYFMVHYGTDDWGGIVRVYNHTTTTPIGVATGAQSSQVAGTASDTAASAGGGYTPVSYIHSQSGVVRQSNCTAVAQTFKAQIWAGRDTLTINSSVNDPNSNITGFRTICSIMVQEIAG